MARGLFSSGYLEARVRFTAAAAQAGAAISERPSAATGPLGEPLRVSVARLGPANARRAVLTISGVHGVEGFCGSACQLAWLQGGFAADLPPDVAVIHVHAINPFGFAAGSRVTEDNIDLNRNFRIDWSALPANRGYEALAAALAPEAWDPARREQASRMLAAYRAAHGDEAWQAAVMGGQYADPEGLFWGGRGPCWSNEAFRAIAGTELAGCAEVVAVDLHTGLGERAAMEIMAIDPPGSAGHTRSRAWFGERVTSPYTGTSSAQQVQGPLLAALPAILPAARTTLLAVEFGTVDTAAVVEALRADNWARRRACPGDGDWMSVKGLMRDRFCPRDPAWEAAVIGQARAFASRIAVGLASGT